MTFQTLVTETSPEVAVAVPVADEFNGEVLRDVLILGNGDIAGLLALIAVVGLAEVLADIHSGLGDRLTGHAIGERLDIANAADSYLL